MPVAYVPSRLPIRDEIPVMLIEEATIAPE
jgi:uncharacterized protein YbaR (Trm112 family)